VCSARKGLGDLRVFKRVDTCAAEFDAETPLPVLLLRRGGWCAPAQAIAAAPFLTL
jgi:hypothetical protein